MNEHEHCIQAMQDATGNKLSEADIRALYEDMLRRAKRNAKPGVSMADALQRFAEEFGRSQEEARAIIERNAHLNALKQEARRGVQQAAFEATGDPTLGIEAGLVGVNTPFAGNRNSVDSIERALTADLIGGVTYDLERAGLEKYARRGMDDDDVARELAELNKRDGRHGITGNDNAKKVAAIFYKYQQAAFAAGNRSGAWLKAFYGYVARTSHNPERIRGIKWHGWITGMPPAEEARNRWSQRILDTVDLAATFGSRDAALKALPQEWSRFTLGQHLADVNPVDESAIRGVGANEGRRLSSSRVYIFKSPEKWAEYNREFGAGNVGAAVLESLARTSRRSALMQWGGTNPRAALESDILHWKKKADTEGNEKLGRAVKERENSMRRYLSVVDGSASLPENWVSNARLQAALRWQRWSKLGSAILSTPGDHPTRLRELARNGVPFFDRWGSVLNAYLGQWSMSADKRELAYLLKAGVDSEIHAAASRYESEVSRPGLGAVIDHGFFKWTGLSYVTDTSRLTMQMMISRQLGFFSGMRMDQLPAEVGPYLRSVGIDSGTWDLLRSVSWREGKEGRYFEPSLVNKLDDAVLAARGDPAEVRADLKQKILQYTHDAGVRGVLEPTARVRAKMTFGTAPGTKMGNAIRLIGQFKSFQVAMIDQAWGAEVYGRSGWGRLGGVSELLVSSLMFGFLSISLRAAVYGMTPPDPRDPQTFIRSLVAGGGLSIYGDLLFGSFSRHGMGSAEYAAGPTFGTAFQALDSYGDWKAGEGSAAAALNLAKQQIPGQNIWLTRTLLDYLLWHRLSEAASPGYLKRMEDRVKQQSKAPWLLRTRQDWWLPPTSAVQ